MVQTPYWLRHSFGAHQMENLSDEEISSLMGNGVAALRQRYQHPDDETLCRKTRAIQEKLDQAREGGEGGFMNYELKDMSKHPIFHFSTTSPDMDDKIVVLHTHRIPVG
jgi:hypothetical protein